MFYKMIDIYGNDKLLTISENDAIPDPDLLVKDKAAWSWFSPWSVEILRKTNSKEHLRKVFKHDYVLTLDELLEREDYPFRPAENE